MLAVVGVVLLYRRGERPEALLIAGMSAAYLIFNSGYETPFGGGSPGPRFLVAIIPFLCFPLALVYQRVPITTIVLAAASAFQMIVVKVTDPTLANHGGWFGRLVEPRVSQTVFGFSRTDSGRLIPVFGLLLLLAAVSAVIATPRPTLTRRDAVRGALALGMWLSVAFLSPQLVDDGAVQLLVLYTVMGAAVLLTLLVPPMLFPTTEERSALAG